MKENPATLNGRPLDQCPPAQVDLARRKVAAKKEAVLHEMGRQYGGLANFVLVINKVQMVRE